MSVNLVVADPDCNYGIICLAITPAMKVLGIKNRCCVYMKFPKKLNILQLRPE